MYEREAPRRIDNPELYVSHIIYIDIDGLFSAATLQTASEANND